MGGKKNIKIWNWDGHEDIELLYANRLIHKFPTHIHNTFSIPIIERGIMQSFYRGEMHYVGPGQCEIINPGEPHTGSSLSDSGWTYRCFYPSMSFMLKIAMEMSDICCSALYFKTTIEDPATISQLYSLHKKLELQDMTLELDTELREAFGKIIQRYSDINSEILYPGNEPSAIKKVKDFLSANYNKNIRIEDIANIACLHPIYLVRSFHKSVGLPPHAYQRQIRVNKAREYLLQGITISEVAVNTGFSDQSHLTRVFKASIGITPGEYQKVYSVQDLK